MQIINQIRQAEKQAEQIVKEGQEKAAALLSQVQQKTEQNHKNAVAAQKQQTARLFEAHTKKAQEQVDQMRDQQCAQRDAVCKAAMKHLDEAAALIYERILG